MARDRHFVGSVRPRCSGHVPPVRLGTDRGSRCSGFFCAERLPDHRQIAGGRIVTEILYPESFPDSACPTGVLGSHLRAWILLQENSIVQERGHHFTPVRAELYPLSATAFDRRKLVHSSLVGAFNRGSILSALANRQVQGCKWFPTPPVDCRNGVVCF